MGNGGRGIGAGLPTGLREFLVERRETLGLSQTGLAKRMGTTQSAVSDLETGETVDPGIGTISRWAQALDLQAAIDLVEPVHRQFVIGSKPD